MTDRQTLIVIRIKIQISDLIILCGEEKKTIKILLWLFSLKPLRNLKPKNVLLHWYSNNWCRQTDWQTDKRTNLSSKISTHAHKLTSFLYSERFSLNKPKYTSFVVKFCLSRLNILFSGCLFAYLGVKIRSFACFFSYLGLKFLKAYFNLK